METAAASLAGVALSPTPQPVVVALVSATMTLGAIALPAGNEGGVELMPATAVLSGVALGPNPDQSRYHPSGRYIRPPITGLSKARVVTTHRRPATISYRRPPS